MPLVPDAHEPTVVAPEMLLSVDQIEQFDI